MPQEVLPRALNVGTNLIRQLDRRSEMLLAQEQGVEVESHRVDIDVRVEVEDMALDGDGVILVQRRPNADVRHALERAGETLESGGGDVDPSARMELVERVDVHGREADLAPQAATGG